MKVQTSKFKEACQLLGDIINNKSLQYKDSELQYLTFVVMDKHLYGIAQGEHVDTQVKLLIDLGETDEQDAVYPVNFNKFVAPLTESGEEFTLEFINDQGTEKAIVISTDFGKIKVQAYGLSNTDNPNSPLNYKKVITSLLTKKTYVETNGNDIEGSVWSRALSASKATSDNELLDSPFVFEREMSGVQLPYFTLRYQVELPFNFALDLDSVKVLVDTSKFVNQESCKAMVEGVSFSYATTNVFIEMLGIRTQTRKITKFAWDFETTTSGMVSKDYLKKLIRVSLIYLEDKAEDIVMDWDFDNQKVFVHNQSIDKTRSGANTSMEFKTVGTGKTATAIYGDALIRVLNMATDEFVRVDIDSERELLHIIFEDGDAYIHYSAE